MAQGSPIVTGYTPIIPTAGATQWSGPLSSLLQALVDNQEARIGASGLDIQSDLTVNGNRVVDLLGVRFVVASSDPGVANSLFLSGSTPEWYLRDGSNNRIQVTAGGFLNVQGSGSIGGDYSSSSAAAIYTNATSHFGFTSSPGVFAVLENGGVRIHNGSSGGAITLGAPAGQASDVSLVLPGALGSVGRRVIEVDATGTMALTQFPLLSGTVAAGGTYRVTGHVQSTDGGLVTGTLQGTQTGSFQVVMGLRDALLASPQTLIVPAAAAAASSPAFIDATAAPPAAVLSTSGRNTHFPVICREGDRIDSYTYYLEKGTATGKVVGQLYRYDGSSGAEVKVGGSTNSTTITGKQTLTSSSIDHTVAVGSQYYLSITGGGTTGDFVYFASFKIARPTGSV